MSNPVLMQWGPVQFQVYPFNIHQIDHKTETDWARKEIAGAAIYREWVGENDEEVFLRGRLFPYFFARRGNSGLSNLEAMETMRREGTAGMLVRGSDSVDVLGWFVAERLVRTDEHLGPDGIGQRINFEVILVRVPTPAADEFFPNIWAIVP